MIPVTKTYLPKIEVYQEYIERIWLSNQLTNNGLLVRELQDKLVKYLDVPYLELLANGMLSLQIAINALGISGEVITTAYSYVATTNSILWEGCTPIFVDVDPETFCIDSRLIEGKVTEKTSAILATHVYGYPCDVEAIELIAKKYGLKVIYDAAHAFGVKIKGTSILNFGDCSVLSFHATKLFHTGEGGAVITQSAEILKQVFLASRFGHVGEDQYIRIGTNAKMSELHAAMGLAVLPDINEVIQNRKIISNLYDELIISDKVRRPKSSYVDCEFNYSYYPVVFESHELMMKIRACLIESGINPRRYFYPSLNKLPFLELDSAVDCPVSEYLAARVLCLPLYVGLLHDDVRRISKIINDLLD